MKYPRLLLGLLVAVLLIGAFAISRADDQSPELVQLDSRSASNPVTSDDNSTFTQGETWVSDPVQPVVVGKVTDATPWDGEFGIDREINPRMTLGSAIVPPPIKEGIDPLLEIQAASSAFRQPDGFETPIINQNGGGFSGVNPPDPVGDVGPDHYVQMINGSQGTIVNIYNKSDGTQAVAPFILDSLAPSGSCTNGFGDPILFFDTIEQRWLLSEFSGSGNFICTYLSDGANPVTATWTFYGFQYPTFPDYFKIGAWDGSLFISANTGLGPMLSAVNWDAMLAGSPSQLVTTTVPGLSAFSFETLTAADRDGFLDVPAGAPGIFMRHNDDEAHQPGSADPNQDWLEVWEYDVDWNNPGAATATQVADIGIAEISSELCGFTAFACVPQPNSSTTLDPLREPVMWRLQYRNFGGYETLVSNLVTDVNGNDLHGIRWFELRRSATEGGTWSLYQEGTISPDSTHRWMGAASMDGAGNIALIYNVSASSGVFPGVRYIGRLASDPLGTMPQGEYVLVNGSSPNASNRYGDYSTLTVDPVDDCTFWGTAEYNPASQWSTRIGAFRFDACGTADFTLSLNPTEVSACAPSTETVTVNVGQVSGFTDPVTLSATGVPANVTTSFAPNPVTPPGSSTLTLNISGSASPGDYTIEVVGTAPTSSKTAELALTIYDAAPTAPTLVSPANGAVGQSITPTLEWNAVAQAASYTVQVATDAAFTNVVYSASNLAGTSHVVATPLNTNTTYYWRVMAENDCGMGVWSAVWSFTTEAAPGDCGVGTTPVVHYATDFESGANGWSTTGSTGPGTWALTTTNANSPVTSYLAQDYASVSDQRLISPPVALPAGNSSYTLAFYNEQVIEDGGSGCYDGGILEISTNGGTSWTQVPNSALLTQPYDGTVDSGFGNPLAGLEAWCGDPAPWTNNIVDLNSYAGQTVQFRFRLGTDSSVGRVPDGWYIDDVQVKSCEAATGATPTATTPATSIELSTLSSESRSGTPWLLLSMAGIVGLAGAAWLSRRRNA